MTPTSRPQLPDRLEAQTRARNEELAKERVAREAARLSVASISSRQDPTPLSQVPHPPQRPATRRRRGLGFF